MNTFLRFASKYSRSSSSSSFRHFSTRKNVKATLMTNKFGDPKIDIVFKKLFTDSDVLVDFINKVLPTKHIKKVEYITNIE